VERSFASLISWREAVEKIWNHAPRLPREVVPLERATGRILAEEITADRDQPPFHRITMDGYALNSADLKNPGSLYLAGQIFAGEDSSLELQRGECVRILTGARLPRGADCVVPQEETRIVGERVVFSRAGRAGQNVAPEGRDARKGDVLLLPGQKLTPAAMALATAVGVVELPVAALPRIRILITGDEIVLPHIQPTAVQERASNGFLLLSALKDQGIQASFSLLGDERAILSAQIHNIMEEGADLLLCTGGVSVGDRDFIADCLLSCGFEMVFHGVNIKPGKPLFFGVRPGTQVLAFPGNPFAVQVGIRIFLEAWLRAATGRQADLPLQLPMGEVRLRKSERSEFFPARLGPLDGQSHIFPVSHSDSGSLRAGLAHGLALQEEAELKSGVPAAFWPLA